MASKANPNISRALTMVCVASGDDANEGIAGDQCPEQESDLEVN